ncbi:MAG: CPXCG motif-containing cysteine-rich protein [Campylobacterales bacterium]|nr:CPXCG motif-containing cysteine-rich protein [Campylobacterales bacterium]
MEEKFFTCPYCHQYVSTLLDTGSDGRNEIVDDCEVCCRPIEIIYSVKDFKITDFRYFPIDGNAF